jgi:hypothetical protein
MRQTQTLIPSTTAYPSSSSIIVEVPVSPTYDKRIGYYACPADQKMLTKSGTNHRCSKCGNSWPKDQRLSGLYHREHVNASVATMFPSALYNFHNTLSPSQAEYTDRTIAFVQKICSNSLSFDPHPCTRSGLPAQPATQCGGALFRIMVSERRSGRLLLYAAYVASKMEAPVLEAVLSA